MSVHGWECVTRKLNKWSMCMDSTDWWVGSIIKWSVRDPVIFLVNCLQISVGVKLGCWQSENLAVEERELVSHHILWRLFINYSVFNMVFHSFLRPIYLTQKPLMFIFSSKFLNSCKCGERRCLGNTCFLRQIPSHPSVFWGPQCHSFLSLYRFLQLNQFLLLHIFSCCQLLLIY